MADRITIKGAREHNLKNLDLEIPRDRLVVITGISGSGKSSLAFDTIYAEGQRRYVESLSAYARQFLEQMEKPEVDSIEGLSPAISIEQKTTSRNPRSTVGTITEIYDYLRLLFARAGHPFCYNCGREIATQSVQQIVDQIMSWPEGTRLHVLAPIVRDRKGEYRKELRELRRAGFVRVKVDGKMRELAEDIELNKTHRHTIEVVVDRLAIHRGIEKRLADSLEVAFKYGQDLLKIERLDDDQRGHLFQPALCLRGMRHLLSRDRAADVLLQQPSWRLPHLLRRRLDDVLRPRAGGAERGPVAGRRRDRSVGGAKLHAAGAGSAGQALWVQPRFSRGRACRRRCARRSLTARAPRKSSFLIAASGAMVMRVRSRACWSGSTSAIARPNRRACARCWRGT